MTNASIRDDTLGIIPTRAVVAEQLAQEHDYPLSSSRQTGALLRVLAASKPGGRILELGTGVGVGAAWLLDGMSADATLDTVEIHPEACQLARKVLGDDPRVTVHEADTREWTRRHADERYDLVFADAGAPKFFEHERTVSLLAAGGLLVADDLLPQDKWVAQHPELVSRYRETVFDDERIITLLIDWASGLSVSARR